MDSKKRNCPQASHSLRSSRPVPREGATVSFLGLPWCAWRSGSSMRRTACLPSQGEQVPESGGLLATTISAVMASTSRSSSLQHDAVCCPASFHFVFPMQCRPVQGKDGAGPLCAVRCWSPQHTTSIAEEGGTTTGRTWRGGGKKAASRTDRGLAQALHLHSRQKRGGFPVLSTW